MSAIPTENEIVMKENDFIVSKTNSSGVITYCNEIFMEMAGYSEEELIGRNHNIIRHPHMPKAAFKLAWELIQEGKEFFGFVKNATKWGAYYWVFANITPDYDEQRNIIGYTSVRRKPKAQALEMIVPLYQKMLEIEQNQGIKASYEYLLNILQENNTTYNALILSLQGEPA